MKNTILVILFFQILLHTRVLYAQDQIILRIMDHWSDLPIPGVLVSTASQNSISDSTGQMVIRHNGDPIKLYISKPGYFSREMVAELQPAVQVIYLTPVMDTDTISVYGGRIRITESDIASGVSRLSARDLAHFSDAAAALATRDGIFINNYGGQESTKSVSMRGLGSEQTLILLDDIPLNHSQTGSVDLGRYATDYFTGAEIYRGGFSTLFGTGAVGGVINLNAGSGPGLFGLNLEKGAFGTDKLLAYMNLYLAESSHTFKFRRNYSPNHYHFLLNGEAGTRENSDFSKSGVQYLGRIPITDKDEISLTGLWNNFSNGSPAAVTGANQGKARLNEEDLLAGLRWHHQYSNLTNLQTLMYLHRNWMEYIDPAVINSRHYNQDAGFKITLKSRLADNLLLFGGIEGRSEKVNSSESGNHERWQSSFLALINWTVWQNQFIFARLNMAVRQEIYAQGHGQFLPRGGLEITSGLWRWYFSAGKNYRQPTLNEFYWQPGGNPDLESEKSVALETGVEYEPDLFDQTTLRVSFYQITLKNMIRWSPVAEGYWRPMNLDKVRSRGIEFETTIWLWNEKLRAELNYKYGHSIKTGSEFEFDRTVGNRLPNIPSTEFSGQLFIEPGNYSAGIELYHMSFRYTTIANLDSDYLSSATILNLIAGYEWSFDRVGIKFYGRINNIFKTEYQFIKNYPVPLQEWLIGMNLFFNQKDL